MKEREFVFAVNGVEQKITAKLLNEIFDNGNGTITSRWDSGRKVITDRYYGKKWSHKKFYDKNGNLESELTRVFDDKGNIISSCLDYADGRRDSTLYEYDENNLACYQKHEILHADGSTKLFELLYKNFLDGDDFDKSKLPLEKETCYRKFDKNGHVVSFINYCWEHENVYDESGNLISAISKENGKIIFKQSFYKSDDGLLEIEKSETYDDKIIRYEIKDCRKSADKPYRISATYIFTEKM